MSVRGIAAGPDQIADGTDASLLASVDKDGNLAAVGKGIDQSGVAQSIRIDDATELLRQNLLVSRAILMVLADAFHPGSDPQYFIDAVSDQ